MNAKLTARRLAKKAERHNARSFAGGTARAKKVTAKALAERAAKRRDELPQELNELRERLYDSAVTSTWWSWTATAT